MKLSEAILEGCKVTEKCRSRFFEDKGTKACILGAACVGFGLPPNRRTDWNACNFIEDYAKDWVLNETICEAVDRNNHTDESRESIAAWLASKGY